jgi:hypothetical protein
MAEESKEEREKRSLSEKWAIWITISGGVIFIIALIWYLASTYFKWGNKLDPTLAAQAGDFIGGIVGSLWALAGVVLVYSALQAQRRDFKINLESLKNQIQEYKEQKEVLEEQSKTLQLQRFETSFFNMTKSLNDVITSFVFILENPEDSSERIVSEGRETFKSIEFDLKTMWEYQGFDVFANKTTQTHFRKIVSLKEDYYGQIPLQFINIFEQIIMLIFDSSLGSERKKYIKILKSYFDPYQFFCLGLFLILHNESKVELLMKLHVLNFYEKQDYFKMESIENSIQFLEECFDKARMRI